MRRRAAAFIGGWGGILAILLALVAGTPAHVAAQSPLPAAIERIRQLVADGRISSAVTEMTTAFDSVPSAQRPLLFEFSARLCIALSDVDCAVALLSRNAVKDHNFANANPSAKGYLMLLVSWVKLATGSYRPEDHLAGRIPAVISPLTEPVLFAEMHLLAARQSQLGFDLQASREHVDKALASVLSMQTERFDAPRLLVRIAGQLLDTYDVERAMRLVAAAEPLLRTIRRDSVQHFELLQLNARLHGYRKDFAAVLRDLRLALSLLERLQLEPGRKTEMKSAIYNDLLGAEAMQDNRAALRDLLRSHPLQTTKPAILQRGHFASDGEFNFAIAEEFARSALQDPSETGWSELLKAAPRWTADPEGIEQIQAFAQAAIGLQLARQGNADARRVFVEAAGKRLATLQRRQQQSVYASPLPSWTDRLLLEFALVATLSDAAPDYDLIVGAHVILDQSLETGLDTALANQASQASEERRRVVQSLATIGNQRAAWEKAQLALLAKRLAAADNATVKEISSERLDVLRAAEEFARQRQRLMAVVTQGSLGITPTPGLLKQLLGQDEALVLHVPALGQAGKICLRNDRITSSMQQIQATDGTDIRRLRDALTATHPPSVEADSQYPAAEAVRLGKLLFGGLEDCLRSARRIYHVDPFAQIPPAALLADMPPRSGAGFDLRAAPWLIRNHSFVKTNSIDAFVAAKVLSKSKRATLDYLGVGDPVLAAQAAGRPSGGTLVARGSVPIQSGALTTLPELPETAEELQRVAALFDKSKTRILKREAATEENFRLEPLSEFDIVHFATHGLIREELPGIPEPSLVLTPSPQGDAFDDGLLTSSQIAALSLRARLVVLSACNSARYDASIINSGIQGLSMSFAIAGVPSMIASLWPIESVLTRGLMVATFQAARGKEEATIADALATAVRKHIDGASARPLLHPRFWASLVVVGDGSLKLGAPDVGPPRTLAAFADTGHLKTEEVLSVAALDGDFVSASIGQWNGKRSPSVIRRQATDGTVKWEVKDAEIGAGPVAATDSSIYVGGYLTPSPAEPGFSMPTLRRLGPDGAVSWSRNVPTNAKSAMVEGMAIAPDQTTIALVGERREADLSLVRFDAEGNETGRMPVPIAGKAQYVLSASVAVHGGAGLVVVNRLPLPSDRVDGLDGLNLPRICFVGDAADIVLFDATELKEIKHVSIQRFAPKGTLPTEDGWLIVGSLRTGCHLDTQAAAFAVTSDGSIKELWRDASPFTTSAAGVRRAGNGFEIIGRTRRTVAIAEQRRPVATPDFNTLRSGEEGYVSDEIFSVRLTGQGVEEGRDFVSAGLPIMPMGMKSAADRSVIFGTVGPRPLWLGR